MQYKNYRIEIEPSDYIENPLDEFACPYILACWHSRYNLGTIQPKNTLEEHTTELVSEYLNDSAWELIPWNGVRELKESVDTDALFDKHYISLPLYLYDHSGITMNTTGYTCRWDSGQVGMIYVSIIAIKKLYGWGRLTIHRKETVLSDMRNVVSVYDKYLCGDYWDYCIYKNDEIIDSCCQFGDYNYCLEEAKEFVDSIKESL